MVCTARVDTARVCPFLLFNQDSIMSFATSVSVEATSGN